jgi:aminoglycoside phosphotransferase (APT) family kinase protein
VTDPTRTEAVARALLGYLSDALREPELDYAEPPERIVGGNNTFVYRFRLAGAPAHRSVPLILRILRSDRDPEDGRFEAAVQNALAALGYPAPRVLFSSANPETLGGAFQVMERLPGRPLLLDGVDGDRVGAALLHDMLPNLRRALFGDWPLQLAQLQLQLHALAPQRFLAALEAQGFSRERLGLGALLDRYGAAIEEDALEGLRPGVDWLRRHQPTHLPPCICHGDMFPNQLLEENGVVTGVIDWSEVRIAPAELDVGIVKAGIETLPLPLPGPLARSASIFPRWAVRRYLSAYEARRPLDADAVRYGEVVRCVQVLLATARRRRALSGESDREPSPDPYDHPLAAEWLSRRVRAIASVEVAIDEI